MLFNHANVSLRLARLCSEHGECRSCLIIAGHTFPGDVFTSGGCYTNFDILTLHNAMTYYYIYDTYCFVVEYTIVS